MKLKWLKDKLGGKFYPIAHATGVVVTENKTLDSKLSEIDKSLTEINEDIKRNGYGEVAGGTNLAKSFANGTHTEAYYFSLLINADIKPSTTYTISFIGVNGHLVYLNEYLFDVGMGVYVTCTGERQYITATTLSELPSAEHHTEGWLILKNQNGNTIMPSFTDVQLEEGTIATDYEPYFPSNKMLAEEKTDKSETTVNLLDYSKAKQKQAYNWTSDNVLNNPTVNFFTLNKETGELSGTSDDYAYILFPIKLKKDENVYIHTDSKASTNFYSLSGTYVTGIVQGTKSLTDFEGYFALCVDKGKSLNDFAMISTSPITEYVPYTGDTGSLNGDVADLRDDVDGFGDELVTRRIQLLANHTADYYRYIEPIRGRDQILIPPVIVNGSSESFDESGDVDSVSFANYSYAKKNSVKMDILDVEVSSSITQAGVTVKYIDKRIDSYKYYNVKGTATSDIEIPLYSVTNPKNNNYLYFVTDSVSKMSSDTFYIKIADDSGNETTLGSDGSKDVKTNLKPSGKVIVYFVIKSGIKVNRYVNVKCGYSSSYCVADFSASKYSDTIDNVLDAILDLNSRLKALENK